MIEVVRNPEESHAEAVTDHAAPSREDEVGREIKELLKFLSYKVQIKSKSNLLKNMTKMWYLTIQKIKLTMWYLTIQVLKLLNLNY